MKHIITYMFLNKGRQNTFLSFNRLCHVHVSLLTRIIFSKYYSPVGRHVSVPTAEYDEKGKGISGSGLISNRLRTVRFHCYSTLPT